MSQEDQQLARAPAAFIFMKIGYHAGETLKDILVRKRDEVRRVGMTYWGYGGSVCHPLHQVQPFAREHLRQQGSVHVLMVPVDSPCNPDLYPANEYSHDNEKWNRIPEGIRVTGSKHALVLDSILPTNTEICLNHYDVAVGQSRGRNAVDYLRGRVDKACLVRSSTSTVRLPSTTVRATYIARLKDPFAVRVR